MNVGSASKGSVHKRGRRLRPSCRGSLVHPPALGQTATRMALAFRAALGLQASAGLWPVDPVSLSLVEPISRLRPMRNATGNRGLFTVIHQMFPNRLPAFTSTLTTSAHNREHRSVGGCGEPKQLVHPQRFGS